jgi:probable F420-dependent oxidoreductase
VIPSTIESRYPETPDGSLPFPAGTPIPDPLVWLAFVAGSAPSLRLGTAVLVLPQRNPLTTAKEAATLDAMSQGRVILGVGVGWLREEFDALGVPFAQRGRRMDEAIEVMRGLWSQEEFGFQGRDYHFAPVHSAPKPASSTVPIHIGGYSEPAAERAGRLGDGFFPGTSDPEGLARLVSVARQAAEAVGRNPEALEVTARGSDDHDHLRALRRAGADRVVVSARSFDRDRFTEEVSAFGAKVVEPFAG